MPDAQSENTQPKRIIGRPFEPGNPGKPKGAKHKLQESFVKDVYAAWKERGAAAVNAMIDEKPGDFVKVVASLIPKEATLNINDHSELTDDELADRIRSLAAQLAPFLSDGTGATDGAGEGSASAQLASRVH